VSDGPAGHLAAVLVQVRTAGGGQPARAGGAERGHPGRTVPGAAGIVAGAGPTAVGTAA